ncbi:MAG TPA: hypothetical protein ENG48_03300 [Candidatus Atribacteria bacterium]|nr:hypothetical protein [Candidatus Atribacteria bacterium]
MKFNLDKRKKNDIKPEQLKIVEDLVEVMCTPEIRPIEDVAKQLNVDVATVRRLIGNPHVKKLIQSRIEDATMFYEARVWEKLMEKIEIENSLDAIKVFFNLKGKNANGYRESNHISINNNQTTASGLTPQQEEIYSNIIDEMSTEDAERLITIESIEDLEEGE